MRAFLTSYWMQKAGNPPDEYEDAFFPKANCEVTRPLLRVALADGATAGMLSKDWAEILVKRLCRAQSAISNFDDMLRGAYSAWTSWQHNYLAERARSGRSIKWYEEPGLEAGAFATLLGLEFVPGRWEAVAVGDCCMFQVRRDDLCESFPLHRSDEFNTNPALIGSRPERNGRLHVSLRMASGQWETEDIFLLMSDALACWFVQSRERGEQPWTILREFVADDQVNAFGEFVNGLRDRKLMRNDDVTLTRLDLLP